MFTTKRLNPLYFGATSKSKIDRARGDVKGLNPLYFGATSKSTGEQDMTKDQAVLIPSISGLHLNQRRGLPRPKPPS